MDEKDTVSEIVMTEAEMQERIEWLENKLADTQLERDEERDKLREAERRNTNLAAERDNIKGELETLRNNVNFAHNVLRAIESHIMTSKQLVGVLMIVKKALDSGYWFNSEQYIPF